MTIEPLNVEVWSDIACPWCWVGLKNLEEAQKLSGENVNVTWRSFQLDPNASTETDTTVDYVEKLAAKYRVSTSESQAMIDRMTQAGASKGIEFRFDRLSPSNTFNAHRLLAWAKSLGYQSQLKERLFSSYLNEGLSLNDPAVLAEAASDVGLDREAAAAVLASDDHADSVLQDRADAESIGVRGVPFFLISSDIALSGAQPPEVIAQALTEVAGSRVGDDLVADDLVADDPSCSIDGC